MNMMSLTIIAIVIALLQRATPLQPTVLRSRSSIGRERLNTHYPVTVLPPNISTSRTETSALIFLPGCFVQPKQYEPLLRKIQQTSNSNLAIAIPRLPLGAADPTLVQEAIRRSFFALQRQGYSSQRGQQVFLGGHSLGSAFLPEFIEEHQDKLAGLILVGAFPQRNTTKLDSIPTLTAVGDLDGLIRTSRIAETYHHHFGKNDTDEAKIKHPVVLMEGMNHFQILQGQAPPMNKARDLDPEIDDATARRRTASVIASFIDAHHDPDGNNKMSINSDNHKKKPGQTVRVDNAQSDLLKHVERTGKYVKPLIDMMELEGSRYLDPDVTGSPWSERIQREILSEFPIANVTDEYHESWYLNPLAKMPFFHPKLNKIHIDDEETGEIIGLDLGTCTEATYERIEPKLDTGFFSNTATELRCKLNSPQVIQQALGNTDAKFQPQVNIAKRMNDFTIEYALKNSPPSVRRRYEEKGIQLKTGDDIPVDDGPSWIWSPLTMEPHTKLKLSKASVAVERSRILQSHTMQTPVDHPVPFAGGKLYIKLLSPARALDWMYTDCLRNPDAMTIAEETSQILTPIPTLGGLPVLNYRKLRSRIKFR